jgi:hypothetical protein
MRYDGYVADIEIGLDAVEIDFEETDYQSVDVALFVNGRIRLEWMEGDESYAVTINNIDYEEIRPSGDGLFECSYPSWEGRRNIVRREVGQLDATVLAFDFEHPISEQDVFWIDVEWKTADDSGRLLFELVRPAT